jgi:hypothetical protein
MSMLMIDRSDQLQTNTFLLKFLLRFFSEALADNNNLLQHFTKLHLRYIIRTSYQSINYIIP